MRHLWILLAASALLVACNDSGTSEPVASEPTLSATGPEATPAPEVEVNTSHHERARKPATPAGEDNEGSAGSTMDPVHGQLGPGLAVDLQPPTEFEPFVRTRRRLTIDQVNASLLAVTGGLTWTLGNNQANQFEALSTTLGVPDYIQVVQEDLAPGAIFQKFLGDAARSVCTQLVAKELASTPGERVLMVHAGPDVFLEDDTEAVEMNLRMLVLRYHGYLANENDPALETWRWLFESVSHVSQSPAEGWRAVCISLITHPDFYLH